MLTAWEPPTLAVAAPHAEAQALSGALQCYEEPDTQFHPDALQVMQFPNETVKTSSLFFIFWALPHFSII